jgi:hypothetical protein
MVSVCFEFKALIITVVAQKTRKIGIPPPDWGLCFSAETV